MAVGVFNEGFDSFGILLRGSEIHDVAGEDMVVPWFGREEKLLGVE
jgi:hypothetical protein